MKKLTKLLSVFIIAGAVGTGVAGVAACNTDEHTHNYNYTDNKDGKTHIAKCNDCDEQIPDQLHVDGDSDKVCDLCGGAVSGSTSSEDAVTGVVITGMKKVAVNGTLQLTATVTATGNAAKTVTWSSSDNAKATVDATGKVTGVAEGQVTITATSTHDTTKKAAYVIEVVPEGTVIEKSNYEKLLEKDNVRAKIDVTATVGAKLTEYDAATAGIYVTGDEGYAAETWVEYADEAGTKVLKQVTTNPNVTGKPNVYTIINPGPVKGEVEGVFTTKTSHLGNASSFIVFNGNRNVNIALTSKGEINVTYNNGTAQSVPVTGVTVAVDTYIEVYFKLNLTEGKMTLTINGVTALDNVETGTTLFNYVQISSSNKGQRVHTTKEIVICGTPKTLQDSKDEAKAIIDAELAKYDKTEYTTNGSELDAAVAVAKTAVDEAADIVAVNQAVADCKAALKAVIKDSDIEAARVKAVEDLKAAYPETRFTFENLTGDDEKYNNKSLYEAKIAEVTAALENKNTAAEMKEITDAAATFLAGKTNSSMLELKVAEAKTALTEYATSFKETLNGDNAEAQKAAVDAAVTTQSGLLESANQITEVNAKIEEAKVAIENAAANVGKSFATVKDESKTAIDEYCAANIGSVNDDATYVGLINASVTKHKGEIDALTEDTTENRTAVDTAVVNAKADIDRYIDNYTKQQEANAYRDAQAATVKNNEVKAEIEALDFTSMFKDITEVADRTTALANAEKQVKDLVDKLAEYQIAVSVGGDEICYVTYGTKLTLSDLHVSGFNVSSATLGGKAVPATPSDDEALTIYNPVNVVVTGKTPIAGFKPSVEWTAATDATDVKNIVNNDLISVTSKGGDKYTDGEFTVGGKTFTRWWTSLNMGQDADNKSTPVVITAKSSLKTLTVYVTLADSAGTGNNRHGSIYAVINGGDPVAIKTLTSKGDMSIAWTPAGDIKAGDIIEIYALNKNGSGARLHLFGVDATVDTDKIEKTVTVTWGTEAPQSYHYFTEITAPNPTGLSDTEKFEYWYYIDGETEVKWTDGSTLAEGNYTFIAKISTVAAVETVEVSASAQTVDIGGSVTLTATAKDTDGNVLEGRTVIWSVGEYQYAEISAAGVLTLKAGAQENDTITVTATIGTKSATINLTVTKPSTVDDAIDMSSDTKTSGHAISFTSTGGYFTVVGVNNYKYSADILGGALIGTSSGRGLKITAGNNVESITITIQLGISGDSKYNSSSKTSTASVTGAITDTISHDTPNEVCEYTFTLKAGETITITGASNLALVGATAVVIPSAA